MSSQAKHSAATRVDWSEIGRAKSAGVKIVAVETRGYATRYIIENTPDKGSDARERSKEDAKPDAKPGAKAEAAKPEPEANAEKQEPLTAKQRRQRARQAKFASRLAEASAASMELVQEEAPLRSDDDSQPEKTPEWAAIVAAPAPSSSPPKAAEPKPKSLAERMQMVGTELDLALGDGAAEGGWKAVEQKPGSWKAGLWDVTSPTGEQFRSLEAAIGERERQSARAEAAAKAMQVDAPTGGDAAKRSKAEAGVKTPTKPPPTSSEGSWTPAGKSRKKALPLPREVRKLEPYQVKAAWKQLVGTWNAGDGGRPTARIGVTNAHFITASHAQWAFPEEWDRTELIGPYPPGAVDAHSRWPMRGMLFGVSHRMRRPSLGLGTHPSSW